MSHTGICVCDVVLSQYGRSSKVKFMSLVRLLTCWHLLIFQDCSLLFDSCETVNERSSGTCRANRAILCSAIGGKPHNDIHSTPSWIAFGLRMAYVCFKKLFFCMYSINVASSTVGTCCRPNCCFLQKKMKHLRQTDVGTSPVCHSPPFQRVCCHNCLWTLHVPFLYFPLQDNLFEWHFTIRGPCDSDFDGCVYHGRIILPPDYPMKPPSIMFLTQNGRFECFTKICLSISKHHPESWQPSWSSECLTISLATLPNFVFAIIYNNHPDISSKI